MLALALKVGERVQVGAIEVTVVEIVYGKVRLGFTGPREIPIVRANAVCKTPKVPNEQENSGVVVGAGVALKIQRVLVS